MDEKKRRLRLPVGFHGARDVGFGYQRNRHIHTVNNNPVFATVYCRHGYNGAGVEKTLIGHVTIPLIIYGLFPNSIDLVALLLGSGVPNFDVFPTLLRKKTPKNPMDEAHASTILHTIFLYVVIIPVLYFILTSLDVGNSLIITTSFSLGGITHVITESFDEKGRRLLYPISKRFYGMKILPYDFWTYLTDKRVLILEGGLFIVAFLLFI